MASVSSNYAEVFVDGGSGAAASRSSEGVVYSDVMVRGGEGVVVEEGASTSASSSQQYQQVSTSSQHTKISSSSSQQQQQQQQQQITISNANNINTLESQLAERIVGYGYQSFDIEDVSVENGSAEAGNKKESRFGQLRRSFGKGKRKRLPTGFAANFASTSDILMKGQSASLFVFIAIYVVVVTTIIIVVFLVAIIFKKKSNYQFGSRSIVKIKF